MKTDGQQNNCSVLNCIGSLEWCCIGELRGTLPRIWNYLPPTSDAMTALKLSGVRGQWNIFTLSVLLKSLLKIWTIFFLQNSLLWPTCQRACIKLVVLLNLSLFSPQSAIV